LLIEHCSAGVGHTRGGVRREKEGREGERRVKEKKGEREGGRGKEKREEGWDGRRKEELQIQTCLTYAASVYFHLMMQCWS